MALGAADAHDARLGRCLVGSLQLLMLKLAWACVVTATADAQAAGPGQRFGLDVTAAADAHDASPLVVLLTLRCSACPTVFGW